MTNEMKRPLSLGNAPASLAETPAEPKSRRYRSQGMDLHFVEWGNSQAPPLILVHGNSDHCRSWDRVASRLAGQWHIFAPDLRGHGDSQWASDGVYSIDCYIYDLAELIEQEKLAPATIVAHSLGGRITLRYSGIYPEKVSRLVVIEGLGPPPSELVIRAAKPVATRLRSWIEDYGVQARPPRGYVALDEMIERFRERNPTFPLETSRQLAVQGARRNDDGTYSWKFDGRVRVPAPLEMSIAEMEALWLNISCPILLLHGSSSFLPDPTIEHRDRQFQDARIEIVNGAGHWGHHEQFEQVMDAIGRFLVPPDHPIDKA